MKDVITLFLVILSKISTHVTVVKLYYLPKTVTNDSVGTNISNNSFIDKFRIEY
jgi:hypothetical protein